MRKKLNSRWLGVLLLVPALVLVGVIGLRPGGGADDVSAQTYFGRIDMDAESGAADADLQTSRTVAVGATFDVEWEVGDFPSGAGLADTTMVVNYPANGTDYVTPTTAAMTVNTGWYKSSLGGASCGVNNTGGDDNSDTILDLTAGCNLPGGSTDSLATGRAWLFQVDFTCDLAVTGGAFDTTDDSDLTDINGYSVPATWGDGTITCAEPTATPTPPPTSTPTITPTPTETPTPIPGVLRIVKDADVDSYGDQTTNNLWLMKNGCATVQQAIEGKGCLYVDKWAKRAVDADTCNDDDDGDTIPCGVNAYPPPPPGAPTDPDEVPEGVGAWEEQIKFDHKIVSLELNPDNAWLQSNGRVANCTMVVATENWILSGCVTKDSVAGPPVDLGALTPDGRIERITVRPMLDDLKLRLRPTKDNGVLTDLIDENCELADIYGEPLPDSLAGGLTQECGDAHITVRMLEGDLDLDCDVDALDHQAIAYRYGSFFGLLLYDPWFDLEPKFTDFDIDIKDLQFVFGRNGSTCQVPIPDRQVPFEPPEP